MLNIVAAALKSKKSNEKSIHYTSLLIKTDQNTYPIKYVIKRGIAIHLPLYQISRAYPHTATTTIAAAAADTTDTATATMAAADVNDLNLLV